MNCVYHQNNLATVQCNSCGRGLCPACDHRVRGFPLCQDCIVAGVEALKQQRANLAARPSIRRRSSPIVALVLSIIPGLGAAYNGQTSKALVHFAIFASFFQVAVISNFEPFFALGFLASLLFAAVDAYRTAQMIRDGLTPEAELDAIAARFAGNPFAWSLMLLTLGTIFLLHTIFNVVLPMRPILAAVIVMLGLYTLYNAWRTRQRRRAPVFNNLSQRSALQANAATVNATQNNFVAGNVISASNRWQNR